MRKQFATIGLSILLGACCNLHAEEPNLTKQQLKIEKSLSFVEEKTNLSLSGRKKMLDGFSTLEPRIKKISCQAMGHSTDKDLLKKVNKEVSLLTKQNAAMTDDQKNRFEKISPSVVELNSEVDCTKI